MGKEKTGRVMAAHQPNFLPYLGFFHKMRQSDIFVIRDECNFSKKEYHERNQIRIDGRHKEDGGPNCRWLTVPIPKKEIYLKDIRIKNEVMEKGKPWNQEMARLIRINYNITPFFKQYFPELERILLNRREMFVDLSLDVISFLRDSFGLEAEIVRASELPGYQKSGNPIQDLANLTKIVGADIYLSGPGGKTYLEREPFQKRGIELRFQKFEHPVYPQRWPGFRPCMSAIDALFNVGPSILEKTEPVEEVAQTV